jgi:hypothetical protein
VKLSEEEALGLCVALAVSEAAAAPDAELEAQTVARTVALGEPVLGAEAVLLLVAPRD